MSGQTAGPFLYIPVRQSFTKIAQDPKECETLEFARKQSNFARAVRELPSLDRWRG